MCGCRLDTGPATPDRPAFKLSQTARTSDVLATNVDCAAIGATAPLAPLTFDRPLVSLQDVRVDIKTCGAGHADIHQARNEFGGPREEGTA